MYFVYVLISLSYGTRYIGSTKDIDKRLKEHNSGKVRYTKGRKPWKLIYKKFVGSRKAAREIEKKLKSGCGKTFLKQIPG